jgi:hypothetical protein
MAHWTCRQSLVLNAFLLILVPAVAQAQADAPGLNPFGVTTPGGVGSRPDAVPGVLRLDDGTARPGRIYLTRDARLQINDNATKRQREVPLSALRRIDARVVKEWDEAEWRFKENANDEKVYTGRHYPAREYEYILTLKDGRTITGPLSAIVYVQPDDAAQKPERFLIHKRDKGPIDTTLSDLRYVKRIDLGTEAGSGKSP